MVPDLPPIKISLESSIIAAETTSPIGNVNGLTDPSFTRCEYPATIFTGILIKLIFLFSGFILPT